ncbi:MAG: leucine-rich repeat domain-containing protein [Clostridia bacterium]|nr:leucine-rich repeat domain-containing protein [Clostridia bacterium]
MTSVTIPNSVTSIGSYAFYNCRITSVNYTGTIEQWCGITFETGYSNPLYSAKNLYLNGALVTDLVIPNTVTKINNFAFDNCNSLTSIIIPDSVTSIGKSAFYNCSSLTSVVIGNSVTSIGSYAFSGCSSLTSIVIPNSVTSIGSYAFYDCDSLTSVVIGDSVTSIGNDAFYSCSSLTRVYYMGNTEQWSEIAISSSNYYLTNATRYYYSETTPTEQGNYWHYVDGVVTIWE